AWAQSKSQSRDERNLQECGKYGQQPGGSVPRLLPRLAHERHAASDGSPHLGAKDCGDHSNPVEEGSTFRRQTIETASSLSVSGGARFHPLGWDALARLASRVLETFGFEGEYLLGS